MYREIELAVCARSGHSRVARWKFHTRSHTIWHTHTHMLHTHAHTHYGTHTMALSHTHAVRVTHAHTHNTSVENVTGKKKKSIFERKQEMHFFPKNKCKKHACNGTRVQMTAANPFPYILSRATPYLNVTLRVAFLRI